MIGAARSALAGILEDAGIRTSAVVPERITPPLAVISPASDWVQSGDTYGSFRVAFDVTIIVQTAANATVSSNLDDAIDAAIQAITEASGFYVGSVDAPQFIGTADFLSASMTVYQNTTL